MMEVDRRARRTNQARLRALVAAHYADIDVRCSHDPYEIEDDLGATIDPQLEMRSARPRLVAVD